MPTFSTPTTSYPNPIGLSGLSPQNADSNDSLATPKSNCQLIRCNQETSDLRTPPATPRLGLSTIHNPTLRISLFSKISNLFDNPKRAEAMDKVISELGQFRSSGIALGGSAALTLRQLDLQNHKSHGAIRVPNDLDIYIHPDCRTEIENLLKRSGVKTDEYWGITDSRLTFHSEDLTVDVFIAEPTIQMDQRFKIKDFLSQVERGPWCNIFSLDSTKDLLERKKSDCFLDVDIKKTTNDITIVDDLFNQIELGQLKAYPSVRSAQKEHLSAEPRCTNTEPMTQNIDISGVKRKLFFG